MFVRERNLVFHTVFKVYDEIKKVSVVNQSEKRLSSGPKEELQ